MNRNEHDTTQHTNSIFYLKTNKGTDEALTCFFHWVDICETLGADFYVVCDNEELKMQLIHVNSSTKNKRFFKFIPSYRNELSDICGNIIDDSWLNTAFALLTPFVHAKEKGFAGIWNIDADDTLILAHPQECAKLLLKAEEYALGQHLDCFSFDMWYSQLNHNSIMHWSFGICYANMSTDFISAMEAGKRIAENTGYSPMHWNLDDFFSFLKGHGLLKCETFYCEGLWFEHCGFAISCHENGRIKYIRDNPWHSEIRKVDYEGVEISKDVINFDLGLAETQSSMMKKIEISINQLRRKVVRIDSDDNIHAKAWGASMDNIFSKCIAEAEKGKRVLDTYYSAHVDNTDHRIAVLVFPDDDSKLIKSAVRYIDAFLSENNYDSAIILSSIDLIGYNLRSLTDKQLHFYKIGQSEMSAVLRFISSIECPNIKVLSFRMGFNTKADALIGFKNITEDIITCYSLLGMVGGSNNEQRNR